MKKLKRCAETIGEFGTGIADRKLPLYAASGTYYIFLAIVPIITLLVSLVQFLPVTETQILSKISEWLPEQVMIIMKRIIAGIYSAGKAAFTISIVLTVFSASSAQRIIMRGIDASYNSLEVKQNIVIFYVRSIIYTVILALVLLINLVLIAYGGTIMNTLIDQFPHVTILGPVFHILKYLRYIVVPVFLFFVFMLMYSFMPKKKRVFKHQWPGALFSAVTWILFSFGFSIYISLSDKFGAYGIIGTIMVAMMWLYYNIFFLLIGGWLNSFIESRKDTVSN